MTTFQLWLCGVVLVLLLAPFVVAQDASPMPMVEFEGSIDYSYSFEPKIENISAALRSSWGSGYTLYYRAGNYKIVYHDSPNVWAIYRVEHNREFDLKKGGNELIYLDCRKEYWPISSVVVDGPDSSTAFPDSHHMKVIYESGVEAHYWYDRSLPVQTSHFKDLNFNPFWRTAGALPSRYEFRTPRYAVTATAVAVRHESVSPETFAVPDLPLKELSIE